MSSFATRARLLGILIATMLLGVPVRGAEGGRFDGKWITTVSCAGSRGALGYSYRFESEVKDGNFHGLHGTEGQPSSLLIDGKIDADGSAKLFATGRTGSKEYVPGRDTPRGTEYNYSIEAHFNDKTGSGKRIEGRPCALEFEKR